MLPKIYFKRVTDGTYIIWGEHQNQYEQGIARLSYTKFKLLRDQLKSLGFDIIKGKRDGSQELDH